MSEINSVEHLETLIKKSTAENPLVIDCYASWCAPCKRIARHIPAFQKSYNASFAKLGIDDEDLADKAMEYGLDKVPFWIIFKDGKQINETLQHSNFEKVNSFLSSVLTKKPQDVDEEIEEKVDADEEILANFLLHNFEVIVKQMKHQFGVSLNTKEAFELLQKHIRASALSSESEFVKHDPVQVKKKIEKCPIEPEVKPEVIHIESVEQIESLIEKSKTGLPLILDCGASWCAPCKRVAPHFEKCSTTYEATFAKLDISEESLDEWSKKKGREKIPYFIIWKKGIQVPEGLQHSNHEIVSAFFEKHLNDPEPPITEENQFDMNFDDDDF